MTVPATGAPAPPPAPSEPTTSPVAAVPEAPTGSPRRYAALDGLRGLAALAVVLQHCLIVDPRLARPTFHRDAVPLTGWREALTYSPLHLFWAGSEAVLVFFVLSGFVLALPFLRSPRPAAGGRLETWAEYYARRLVRLYLPVWGAVGFAVLTVLLVPRGVDPSQSMATNLNAVTLTWASVGRDLVVLGGTDTLDGPLWSLQWELVFSLLLPVYLLAVRPRSAWLLLLAGVVLCLAIGYRTGVSSLVFLPAFLVGVLMARHQAALSAGAARVGRVGWGVLVLVAIGLLLSAWTPLGWPRSPVPSIFGAALLVLVFLSSPGARRLATSRPVAWLGAVSFSLYLVHAPVVSATTTLTGSTDPLVVGGLALPLSLLAAAAFHRAVEQPAHRLARRVGRRARALATSVAAPAAA